MKGWKTTSRSRIALFLSFSRELEILTKKFRIWPKKIFSSNISRYWMIMEISLNHLSRLWKSKKELRNGFKTWFELLLVFLVIDWILRQGWMALKFIKVKVKSSKTLRKKVKIWRMLSLQLKFLEVFRLRKWMLTRHLRMVHQASVSQYSTGPTLSTQRVVITLKIHCTIWSTTTQWCGVSSINLSRNSRQLQESGKALTNPPSQVWTSPTPCWAEPIFWDNQRWILRPWIWARTRSCRPWTESRTSLILQGIRAHRASRGCFASMIPTKTSLKVAPPAQYSEMKRFHRFSKMDSTGQSAMQALNQDRG